MGGSFEIGVGVGYFIAALTVGGVLAGGATVTWATPVMFVIFGLIWCVIGLLGRRRRHE